MEDLPWAQESQHQPQNATLEKAAKLINTVQVTFINTFLAAMTEFAAFLQLVKFFLRSIVIVGCYHSYYSLHYNCKYNTKIKSPKFLLSK